MRHEPRHHELCHGVGILHHIHSWFLNSLVVSLAATSYERKCYHKPTEGIHLTRALQSLQMLPRTVAIRWYADLPPVVHLPVSLLTPRSRPALTSIIVAYISLKDSCPRQHRIHPAAFLSSLVVQWWIVPLRGQGLKSIIGIRSLTVLQLLLAALLEDNLSI